MVIDKKEIAELIGGLFVLIFLLIIIEGGFIILTDNWKVGLFILYIFLFIKLLCDKR